MSVEKQATYSDPSIHFLTQVLNQVRDGGIRVPRFQRPFVWLEDRQLELLRSIRQGIPIGALMVWRTSGADVKYYEDLGGLPVARGSGGSAQQYLLDGVQRVSTLYRALASKQELASIDNRQASAPIVYFSFRENDFVFGTIGEQSSHLMPLNVIVDTLSLIKYQRDLASTGEDEWLAASDEIARAFRDYKVPIIPITTNDLEIATLTFQRINRQGEEMSDLHMIHALTWSNSFDLQDSLESAKEDILKPLGWDSVEDDVILKICKGFCGLNLYKTEPIKLGERLKNDPSLLMRALEGVAFAAQWFRDTLSIESPHDIPYTFQIVFVALCTDIIKPDHERLFEDWFWFTTYSEAFSGMSDDRVRRALDDFRSMLIEERPVWTDRKRASFAAWRGDRFDFRSVRTKAILLNLARRIQSVTGHNAFADLKIYGRDAVRYVYPRAMVGKKFPSVGNRALLPPDSDLINSGDLREGASEEFLEAHFLSEPEFWSAETVVEDRARRIERYILDHIKETAAKFLESTVQLPRN